MLRDLSHELDYALWLFGPWQRLTALGGHFSPLEIDSDDVFSLLMETARCPVVSVHMSYVDRVPHREIVVNTDDQTVRVDLIENTMEIDGMAESVHVAKDDTYRAEHEAMLSESDDVLCTLEEAMETLYAIDAAEQAATSCSWVER